MTDKAALRAELAARRAAAATLDAGERLAGAFPADLVPPPGSAVAGYVRYRSEIDPLPLMLRLAAAGCVLALPKTPVSRGGGTLSFRLWHPGDPLVESSFGVMEPAPEAPETRPDLVLVPLLGFDRALHRLGYGAGHYDRTLAGLRATAVGLAYTAQEVEALPVEAHDIPLDAVVTPDFVRRRA